MVKRRDRFAHRRTALVPGSQTEPGWPQSEAMPFKACLAIVLNEEWEHRRYADRDLTVLGAPGPG
jgi:hypothetical protein